MEPLLPSGCELTSTRDETCLNPAGDGEEASGVDVGVKANETTTPTTPLYQPATGTLHPLTPTQGDMDKTAGSETVHALASQLKMGGGCGDAGDSDAPELPNSLAKLHAGSSSNALLGERAMVAADDALISARHETASLIYRRRCIRACLADMAAGSVSYTGIVSPLATYGGRQRSIERSLSPPSPQRRGASLSQREEGGGLLAQSTTFGFSTDVVVHADEGTVATALGYDTLPQRLIAPVAMSGPNTRATNVAALNCMGAGWSEQAMSTTRVAQWGGNASGRQPSVSQLTSDPYARVRYATYDVPMYTSTMSLNCVVNGGNALMDSSQRCNGFGAHSPSEYDGARGHWEDRARPSSDQIAQALMGSVRSVVIPNYHPEDACGGWRSTQPDAVYPSKVADHVSSIMQASHSLMPDLNQSPPHYGGKHHPYDTHQWDESCGRGIDGEVYHSHPACQPNLHFQPTPDPKAEFGRVPKGCNQCVQGERVQYLSV